MSKTKIVGVIDEAPFDPHTWSGSSRFLFNALKSNGVLADAVSPDVNSFFKRLVQMITFSPNRRRWKSKYHLNTRLFDHMSKRVEKKLIDINDSFNVLLQVGAWYNLLDSRELKGKIFCSYHDGNLATQLSRPDISYNVNDLYIRKALDYEKRLYQGLDYIFPMSEWLRQSFINDFGCKPDKVVAVGAGVNLEYIPKIETKDYTSKNILFVGVDFIRKGGNDLLEAFDIVRKKMPSASLTIIGPTLRNLPENVCCIGRISKNTSEGEKKLHQFYEDASIFVLPSHYEPFGISLAEAMAHKLPCVGTRTCAIPEIIDDGKTGFLTPVGDPRALADKILDLLEHNEIMRQFGAAGFKKYEQNYTWKKVAERICNTVSAAA